MDRTAWAPYVARDRHRAICANQPLPDRAPGAVLYADIVGFTNLSHSLVQALGPQQGAEELTRHLNHCYSQVIAIIHHYGGEIVMFGGDSVTCWFGGPDALPAAACGLALQAAMAGLGQIVLLDGAAVTLALKVCVAYGMATRTVVGDPDIQSFDLLIGERVQRMLALDRVARPGEVLLDAAAADSVGAACRTRAIADAAGAVAVLGLAEDAELSLAPTAPAPCEAEAAIRRWVPQAIAAWINAGDDRALATVRPAAILFAGFSGIDFDHDPAALDRIDAVIRWVQHTLEPFDSCVFHVSATVDGWCIYAGFGVPLAHADSPSQALDAALALREVPADWGVAITLGVSWGYVHAGCYGSYERRTYAPLGQTVNLAFRLMSRAPAGSILISAGLRDLAPARYQFADAPPIALKGFPQPVAVWVLNGRNAPMPNPLGASGATLLPGRKHLLARAVELLDSVRSSQPQVALIEGDVGMGKSRLVQRIQELARAQGFTVAVSRSQPQSPTDFDALWRPLLRPVLGLRPGMPPDQKTAAIKDFVAGQIPQLLPRLALLYRLFGLAGPETAGELGDAAWEMQQRAALLVDLLRGFALGAPLLLVIEESHWLDEPVWRTLHSVLATLMDEPLPLAVVLVARPGQHAQRVAALPWVSRLVLEPLPDEGVRTLAALHLGVAPAAVPADLIGVIQGRAQGNPFIVGELLTLMREQHVIVRHDSPSGARLSLTRTIADLNQMFPISVYEFLLAQLDRLAPIQHMTVRVAAALGSPWDRALLVLAVRRLFTYAESEAAAALDSLLEQGLFALADETEQQGVFVHQLLQEVAYTVMLTDERQRTHQIIADCYLERAGGPDAPDLAAGAADIATHYQRANLPERERIYARLAGAWALDHGSLQQAVHFLSRAIDLLPAQAGPEERIELLLWREQAWHFLGERGQQQADLAELGRLAPRRQRALYATVLLRQARFAVLRGDYHSAREYLQGVALCVDSLDDPAATRRLSIDCNLQLGMVLERQADYPGALAAVAAAQALAAGHDPAAEQRAIFALGRIAEHQGRYADAAGHYEAALAQAAGRGDALQSATILLHLGQLAYHQGQYAVARDYFARALAQSRSLGDRLTQAQVLTQLAWLSLDQQEYTEAQSYLQQALTLARSTEDRQGEILALRCAAYSAYAYGRYPRARQQSLRVLELARQGGFREAEAWALEHLGLIALSAGDLAASLDYAEQAVALARAIGSQRRQGFALTIQGYGLLAADQAEQALAVFQAAIDIRQQLGERDVLAESRAGWALAALRLGRIADALVLVEPIIADLGAGPFAGADDPAQIYLACADVLAAAGDPRLPDLIAQARAYLATRSAAIADPQLRQTFELNVPTHRRIRALS